MLNPTHGGTLHYQSADISITDGLVLGWVRFILWLGWVQFCVKTYARNEGIRDCMLQSNCEL